MLLTAIHAKVAAGVLAAGGVLYGGYTLVQEHDARVRAEAIVTANEKIAKTAEVQALALKDEIAKRDQAALDREKALIDAVAKLKTTPQIVPYVQSSLAPNAPVPIIVTVPAATAANPTPNAVISVPQADLPALRDRLSNCDLNAVRFMTCQSDAVANAERLRLAGVALSAAETERDAYKTELKGGTFWRRTKKALEFVGLGVAIAIGAACGSGHCK
jgi:hypothetical protein